jgi:hypothetical protein
MVVGALAASPMATGRGGASLDVPRESVCLLSIFARDGATGFRPYGATRQDDAGGIPGEKPNDERCRLRSNWFGKHLPSCEVRPVGSEAGTGDDDDVGSVCETVQTRQAG